MIFIKIILFMRYKTLMSRILFSSVSQFSHQESFSLRNGQISNSSVKYGYLSNLQEETAASAIKTKFIQTEFAVSIENYMKTKQIIKVCQHGQGRFGRDGSKIVCDLFSKPNNMLSSTCVS